MINEPLGGIVLCGGKSSRFGSHKGSYIFKNKLLIDYSIDLLKKVSSDIIVSGSAYAGTNISQLIEDIYLNKGPMGGLHASLTHSNYSYNIVLACDIPFIHVSIIQKLIDAAQNGADIVIFQTPDKKYHPLIGLYHKNCLSDLENHLKNNQIKLIQFILSQKHQIIKLDHTDHLKSFININHLTDISPYE
jgi:molybdopterin-guanine dinucleotide biosynthesis protein A